MTKTLSDILIAFQVGVVGPLGIVGPQADCVLCSVSHSPCIDEIIGDS